MKPKDILKKNGKTFFWASQFLPKDQAKDIAILYSFCRFVDDLVDIHQQPCDQILYDLKNKKSQIQQVHDFLEMAKARNMSLEPAEILVSSLSCDRRGLRIKTWAELLRYCYGAAATVGLMMCDIFGVQNERAYFFAIDLGIAMQLTNISRDIYEDAVQNKIYLPQEAFSRPLEPKDIDHSDQIFDVQEQLLQLADTYYKSSNSGMHYLSTHARLAIMIASRLYQAKGFTIRKNSRFYLKNRADVGLIRKIFHSSRALTSFFFDPSYTTGMRSTHQASLHQDLLFLPGTNLP